MEPVVRDTFLAAAEVAAALPGLPDNVVALRPRRMRRPVLAPEPQPPRLAA